MCLINNPIKYISSAFFLLLYTSTLLSQQPTTGSQITTKEEKLSLKAFKLTKFDAREIGNTVKNLLLDRNASNRFAGGGFAGNGLGGGFGGNGLNGFVGGFPSRNWHTIVDPRTDTLVVRGTEIELQIVSDLLAIIEAPADKPQPKAKAKNLEVFRLKHATPEELVDLLHFETQFLTPSFTEMLIIEQQVRVASIKSAQILVATGTEDSLAKIVDVVKTLDVPTPAKSKNKLDTKVFRIKQCNPNDIKTVLESLLREEDPDDLFARDPLLMPRGEPAVDSLKILVDERTGFVVVRGTEEELLTAFNVVAILETPPGKLLPKVELLDAFELKHADAETLTTLLKQLELNNVRFVPLPGAKLILVKGREADVKLVGNLIKELDVPENKEDPLERKNLFERIIPGRGMRILPVNVG